jgi:hypothetical protein
MIIAQFKIKKRSKMAVVRSAILVDDRLAHALESRLVS